MSTNQIPCVKCGARLEFVPGTDHIACPYCGHNQSVGGDRDAISYTAKEYSFDEIIEKMSAPAAISMGNEKEEVACESCGARSVITGHADRCAFCGSPVILDPARGGEVVVPESVLPFAIDREKAKEFFEKWIRSLWFAPGKLKERAKGEGIDGAYIPYWTFDSSTTTRYSGERGEYYKETEHFTDEKGEAKTREVTKIRWHSTGGTVSDSFNDVLVPAVTSLPSQLIESLEPWDLEKLKPFAPEYLAGFIAQKSSINIKEGFKIAESKMRNKIENAVRADIGGNEQRIHAMDVSHSNVKLKQILLPLWISSFRFRSKVYRFLVNAQTGEVQGDRPWSILKILGFIAAVILVLALISQFR